MLIQKNKMIERYLTQTHFTSEEDFRDNLHFVVPETFNFAYDVMDEWAKVAPDKLALLWTSERGEELRATYAEFKEQTDQAASYFLSLGIGRGDKVMLILKRHYQWWVSMMALCKIGGSSYSSYSHVDCKRYCLSESACICKSYYMCQ